MNVVYVDTSVLVSLFFEDSDSNNRFSRLLKEADEVVSSVLIEAEFLSVILREKINLSAGVDYLKQISLVIPDRSISKELGVIFSKAYVRGADAFHLACALYLDPKASELQFLTADIQQQKAAQALGFSL
ncbi:MAG: type II toxin-antitoxin system VapC family toxin [Myxococcaceae bacterium]